MMVSVTLPALIAVQPMVSLGTREAIVCLKQGVERSGGTVRRHVRRLLICSLSNKHVSVMICWILFRLVERLGRRFHVLVGPTICRDVV
jgi:hypothetical protein